MDSLDPFFAGVEIATRIRTGNGLVSDDSGDAGSGAGDDEGEILRQGEEAEVAEIAGFSGDSDDISKSDDYNEDTEKKNTRQNIPEKIRLSSGRFHGRSNYSEDRTSTQKGGLFSSLSELYFFLKKKIWKL